MNFLGIITNDQSKLHTKGQGQRSKVKVTKVKTPPNCFRTVTPVWIYIWWWNDAQSLMLLMRGAVLFFHGHPSNFKVTRLKKSSILTQIGRFRTVTPDWIHQWLRNDAQTWSSIEEVPYWFLRSSIKFQGGDQMDATLLLSEILYSQIRKEINIPIMISIFTQFILYDLLWDMVMCGARLIKGSIIFSRKTTANLIFGDIRPSNFLLGMTV